MDIEPNDVLARRPVISLVTSSERLRAHGAGDYSILDAQVRAAIAAGVDLVQFREPGLPDAVLLNLVRRAVELAQGSTTRILVNGRIDVALASSAHGVHLPADGVPADRARPYLPRGFLVGRSVHGLVEAQGVVAEGGVDYLTMGTLFPSASKPGGLACGPQALAALVQSVSVPVLGIGGVTIERMKAVLDAGAAGMAAIGIFAEPGPGRAFGSLAHVVRELRRVGAENHVQRA